ncbi:MAG: hypothetical protein DI539_25560 [Flavobacterium psychrophilum]|nr:MAG: hypothetical protein DI539_25560 [Flavobacterium psychrophilum]
MGMNEFGLAITINLVVSKGWQIGIPPYLLVRRLLQSHTIEECLQIIKTLTIASSRSLSIMDQTRLVNIEVTPTGWKMIENNYLSHTNHFLHPDWTESESLNSFSKNSSVKRKSILDHYMAKGLNLSNIQLAFEDHSLYPVGICAHNEGDDRLSETVAAVIMRPRLKQFLALKGNPCKNKYFYFSL